MTEQDRHYESDAAAYDEQAPDVAHEDPAGETDDPADTQEAHGDDPDAGELPGELPEVGDDQQFGGEVT